MLKNALSRQFSLRLLLLSIVPIALFLAFVSNRARIQQTAVSHVYALGGRVVYDYQSQDFLHPKRPTTPPPVPHWLHDAIGIDYFASVKSVRIKEATISRSDMAIIARLRSVTAISLDDCALSAGALEPIRQMTRLESVSLRDSHAGNEQLKDVWRLPRLWDLDLTACDVSDEFFADIPDQSRLRILFFGRNPITDKGLAMLSKCTHLESIEVGKTKVTGTGIQQLREQFPDLEYSMSSSVIE